jgi:hypothetical protein
MPSHILVRRHAWAGGLVYTIVGGPDAGRTLSLADYCKLVDAGTPVVRKLT